MPATEPDVVILGAGMSGVAAAIALTRAGKRSFVMLEQAAGIGGTWWDNRYPGAQCDVPSHLYSFSFAPNPDWSRAFAPAAEIQRYVERVARQAGITDRLRLGVRVLSARWDDATGRWDIATTGGTFRPRHFVVSLGPLNHPRYPDGIEAFQGPVQHTSRWDPGVDLGMRRVAVIGSAASAVQVIPPLAASAAHVTVFQRTPSWVVARPDRPYGSLERALFRFAPWSRLYRWWLYWEFEARVPAFRGRGLAHTLLRRMARQQLERQVADPALRERLTPTYPIGCKRILLSNDFYPTLAQENVTLVNAAAARFTANSVIAADGTETPVDAIVCATGFDAMDPLASLPIEGRDGATLAATWRDGPEAYRGVTVPGFPNLYLMLGPNSATGHTSVLIPIEAQAGYVVTCIEALARGNADSLEVREAAMRLYNARIQTRLAATVWASDRCRSWYKTPSGRVLAIYPGPITRYALGLRRLHREDYTFRRHRADGG
jgi:cation diffusion facilitator CzcD-associated flavoprotein CzcO